MQRSGYFTTAGMFFWRKKLIELAGVFYYIYKAKHYVGGALKKGTRILVLLLSISLLLAVEASAAFTVKPSSFNVPGGKSSALTVTYRFTGNPSINTILNSPGGAFTVGSEPVGSVSLPVKVSIKKGSGGASETVHIPVSVIERALSRGATFFTYVRKFSGPGIGPFTTLVHFTMTTEADAGFAISRITLYFDNKRPEVLVERGQQIRAYADIGFVGSGLLEGYWEVDARTLSHVSQHLVFGGSTTLQTLMLPSLPTFETGTHTVRFVITNPAVGIPFPSILYFVFPEGAACSVLNISPIEPSDGLKAPYAPLRFAWGRGGATTMYVIGFYTDEEPDSKPVFSAYVRDTSYTLTEQVLRSLFIPGQTYYWKVQGFDKEAAMICESSMQEFIFVRNTEKTDTQD
jgi:hypothetical protein